MNALEMQRLFYDYRDIIANTKKLSARLQFELTGLGYEFPASGEPDLLTEAEQVFAPKKPKTVKPKAKTSTKAKPGKVTLPSEGGRMEESSLSRSASPLAPDPSGAALLFTPFCGAGSPPLVSPAPLFRFIRPSRAGCAEKTRPSCAYPAYQEEPTQRLH